MSDYITVQSTKTDQRVCLHEFDAAHPNGEVFVVNDGNPYRVGLTAAINQRLQDGTLTEVHPKSKKAEQPAEQDKQAPTEPEGSVTMAVEDEPVKRGRKPSK